MKKNLIVSIIREARLDENRAPFTPYQTAILKKKFPNLRILVQTSKNRCFRDEEYLKAGADIMEDVSQADIFFGVKEVDVSKLIEKKCYRSK